MKEFGGGGEFFSSIIIMTKIWKGAEYKSVYEQPQQNVKGG